MPQARKMLKRCRNRIVSTNCDKLQISLTESKNKGPRIEPRGNQRFYKMTETQLLKFTRKYQFIKKYSMVQSIRRSTEENQKKVITT